MKTSKLSFLIVDDHKMLQEGLKNLVLKYFDKSTIHLSENRSSIFDILSETTIDIILLDLFLKNEDSRTFLKNITSLQPSAKIIVVSSVADSEVINALLLSGATAFVHKSSSSEVIIEAIHSVLSNKQFKDKIEKSGLEKDENSIQLTRREKEVLAETLKGKKLKEIADALCVSIKSVENHRNNLFIKFGVNNVAGLVKEAILLGFHVKK